MGNAVLALGASFLVAVVATPAGVSGAVFLLPIQLDVLRVPSPSLTPTNLLFNVISTPGAVWRYHRAGVIDPLLLRALLWGSLPGVVLGTVLRVELAPGDRAFRLLAAVLLGILGLRLCLQTIPCPATRRLRPRPPQRARARALRPATITAIGVGTGTIGGLYGIGGGSLIGPILAGAGMSVAAVAPAALTTTALTSVVGVATYAGLALTTSAPVGPDWAVGLLCGLGGLLGGYLGARLQPHAPETTLRTLLGLLACALATIYTLQATLGL